MHGTFKDIGAAPQEFDAAAISAEAGDGFYRWAAAILVAALGLVAGAAGGVVTALATGLIGLC